MGIYCASGKFGSGKTAFISFMATQTAAGNHVPLWSNYNLRGATPIRTYDDLYACEDGVIALSELQIICDSRDMKKAKLFIEWFLQCRKSGCEIYFDTQALHQVDKRVRDNSDIYFELRKLGASFSGVEVWDLSTLQMVNTFAIDRRWSYDLYNHRERAWTLEEAAEAVMEKIPTRTGRSARAASAAPA